MADSAPAPPNVFPGLRPFEPEETYLFFGRDGQSDELIRRLARNRFLAVVGSSGSGKSSLVRAGLIASLRSGFMSEAGSSWRIALLRPGLNPVSSLAHALSAPQALGRSDLDSETRLNHIEATLHRSSFGLVEAVRQAHLEAQENLLVIVDQFEEIFRLRGARAKASGTEDEASAFVKLLLEAARQSELPIYVVITMRSDFIGDCSEFRDLPEALNQSQYLIPRMTRDQCREAIEGPIAVGGATISARLLQRLLNDVGDDPDHLPVLQHALMRTWEAWTGRGVATEPVDLVQYEQIGGMATALSRHADEAYQELDEQGRQIARKMFQRLSEKGKDNRETRRPTRLREICAVVDADEARVIAVIDKFRTHGRTFLTPSASQPLGPESLIEISHESLIRLWDRLRLWSEAEAESAALYRRLADAAVRHAAGSAALWRNPELQLALEWKDAVHPNEAWAQRYGGELSTVFGFLELSHAESDRRELVRRAAFYGSFAAALVFGFLGLFAFRELTEARRLTALSFSGKLASQAQLIRNENPGQIQLAALLAVEAARRAPVTESTNALFDSLYSLPVSRLSFPKSDPPDETPVRVALSADGHYAARSEAGRVRVFDSVRHTELLRFDIPHYVRSVALSPDGRFLGIADDYSVSVMKITAAKNVWRRAVISPVAIALSSGARYAAVSYGSRIEVFNLASDAEVFRLPRREEKEERGGSAGRSGHPQPPSTGRGPPPFGRDGYKTMAFSADGHLFAAAGENVENAVYKIESGEEAFELSGARHVSALAFGPANDVVATAGEDVSLFDQSTGIVRERFRPEGRVGALALNSGSRYLAAAAEHGVELYDLGSGRRIQSLFSNESARNVLFGDADQHLLVETDNRLATFDVVAGRKLALSDASEIRPIAFSPGARYLALGFLRAYGMTACREVDVSSGEVTSTLELPSDLASGLAVSADGRYLATLANFRAKVPIFETRTGNERRESLTQGLYSAFAFSADGRHLAVARDISGNGVHQSEVLISKRTDASRVTPVMPGFPVTALSFSPEGAYLAVTDSTSVVVYETASHKEIGRLRTTEDLRAIALSSEAQYLLAAGGKFSIYDVASGEELMSVVTPAQSRAMALTSDGQHVLIGSLDPDGIALARYPSTIPTMIDEACSRLDRNLTPQEWSRYLAHEHYRKTCPQIQ